MLRAPDREGDHHRHAHFEYASDFVTSMGQELDGDADATLVELRVAEREDRVLVEVEPMCDPAYPADRLV
jgi:hypothetical protein